MLKDSTSHTSLSLSRNRLRLLNVKYLSEYMSTWDS